MASAIESGSATIPTTKPANRSVPNARRSYPVANERRSATASGTPAGNDSPARTFRRPAIAEIYMFAGRRSEEHTSELQSQSNLVCRLLLEKKKKKHRHN